MRFVQRSERAAARAALLILALIGFTCLAGCGRRHHAAPVRDGEDSADLIHRVQLQDGAVVARDSLPLPPRAYSWWTRADAPAEPAHPASDKIHPRLRADLAQLGASDRVRVLATFRDTVTVPRIPAVSPQGGPPDSMAIVANLAHVDSAMKLRAADQHQDSLLISGLGATILRRSWLTHTYLLDAPKSAVDALAARPDVLYLRAPRAGEGPPATVCSAGDSPCAARKQIRSDPYYDAGFGRGRIALLDTGVRWDHRLLEGWPPRVIALRDCVGGNEECLSGNPQDHCAVGHGTSAAAILTGHPVAESTPESETEPRFDSDYRGVTAAEIESYRVYDSCASCGDCAELDADAAGRAFEVAVLRGAPVILAEIAGYDPEDQVLIAQAEKAYQAGRVVIAANGNAGTASAAAPASSGCVMGIGAYDVRLPVSGLPMSNLSGGIVGGRMKPDLLAPSGTRTAGNVDRNNTTWFTATSGASPYAAGAALMLWNLMRGDAPDLDPGKVYAALVLAARGRFPFQPKAGAGPIQLPTNCWLLWGKVDLAHGEQSDVPLAIQGQTPTWIEGAIWWPEPSDASRRNIDLSLIQPSGQPSAQPAAASTSTDTVFERVALAGPVAAGEWKLRIKAAQVPGAGNVQTVFWVAALGRY